MTTSFVQRKKSRGTATVEMVLVGMLLIQLTFFAIEFSWLFLRKQQVTNACRQAARTAAVVDSTNTLVTSSITSQMTSYGMATSNYVTTFTPTDVSTATKGQTVTVKITVPYANIQATPASMGLWTLFKILPDNVTATVTMVKEGE